MKLNTTAFYLNYESDRIRNSMDSHPSFLSLTLSVPSIRTNDTDSAPDWNGTVQTPLYRLFRCLRTLHLVIDKDMITYRDRTVDKIKLLNKPIKEDYKLWILGDVDYVYD